MCVNVFIHVNVIIKNLICLSSCNVKEAEYKTD